MFFDVRIEIKDVETWEEIREGIKRGFKGKKIFDLCLMNVD